MTKTAFLISFHLFLIFLMGLSAQNNGELLFSQKCVSCHTIGRGKLIGPDLSNVHKIRTEDWIIKFVQSSQSVIKSGDSTAVAVFNQYNQTVMPDQKLSVNEIKSIIDYIRTNSADPNNPNQKTPNQIFNATTITVVDIESGRKIFDGTTKLTNRGPSCITCHSISNPVISNGGLLAKDLTAAFTRMGAQGIDGILRNSPFPAMMDAFSFNRLTDQEIKDLLAFLYYVDKKGTMKIPIIERESSLLLGVVVISNISLVIFLLLWTKVKKHSINFR
ncbi:hypothetical protein C0389_03255 [bacterium]|nr:hypothetical protein [bacterium]